MQLIFAANGANVHSVETDAEAIVRGEWIDEAQGIFAAYLQATQGQLTQFEVRFE